MIRLDVSDLLVIVGAIVAGVSLWLLSPYLAGTFLGLLLLAFGLLRAS